MILLQGHWFNGRTSARIAVELQVDDTGLVRVIELENHQVLQECVFSELKISSRLGDTPRFIYFSKGEKLETVANAEVDQLLEKYRPSFFNTLAHQLESHIYFVCFTLVALVLLAGAGVKYGLPAASKTIAYRLPQNVMSLASTETLALLDKIHLKPSQLDKDIQIRVLQHFDPLLKENSDLHLHILFREGSDLGANAFALPDGTVIFTDEMVRLARDDNELLAVLAHEVGHVKYRHGLRAAIQSASIGFFVSMLTGDLSAASGLITTLPVILTTMSYSREFEREADQNALEFLDAHKIERHYFVDLMERVTYESHCDFLLQAEQHIQGPENKDKKEAQESVSKVPLTEEQLAARKIQCDKLIAAHKSEKSEFMDYFSTHPATEERLLEFKKPR